MKRRYVSRTPYFDKLNDIVLLIFIEMVKQGYTLTGLAEASGLSYPTIWRLDCGITELPRFKTIFSLCKALNIEIDLTVKKAKLRIAQ